MKFSESLKKNSDFQKVYRQGKSYANRYLVMYVLEIIQKEIVLAYPSVKKLETVLSDII